MDQQVIFYNNIVSLNTSDHKNLKIKPSQDYSFAGHTNSVPLTGPEFNEASKEYPITFAKAADQEFVAVAVLGLADGENLFVTDTGLWQGRYLPAFIRRYPFVPAESTEDKLIVCFDETCRRFNETEGEPLVVEGEPSAFLRQIMNFLQEFHRQTLQTKAFVKKLSEWKLLIERQAEAVTLDGQHHRLSGFWVVDEAAFRGLDKDQVLELFSSGELALIYQHLASLTNFQHLLTRKQNGAVAIKH